MPNLHQKSWTVSTSTKTLHKYVECWWCWRTKDGHFDFIHDCVVFTATYWLYKFKNFKDFLSRDNSLYYGGFHLHLLVFPFVYQFISGKPVKIVKKLLDYLLVGMFMDKGKIFCDHSMILWEMAGNLLTNGWIPPHPHTPPGFLGLKKRFRFYLLR